MDQCVWRIVLAWADKFKVEMVGGDEAPESWFYDALSRSWFLEQFNQRIWHPFTERVDAAVGTMLKTPVAPVERTADERPSMSLIMVGVVVVAVVIAP